MTSTVLPDTAARSRSGSDSRGGLTSLSIALSPSSLEVAYPQRAHATRAVALESSRSCSFLGPRWGGFVAEWC